MDIGNRIKKKRLALGMSQEELAKALGYKSRSSINKIEVDGRGLPQSKIMKIAKVLGTTPSYLMGWEEEQQKVTEAYEALTASDIIKKAFNDTGYYPSEFTDDEIIEIMQYASFVLTKRGK